MPPWPRTAYRLTALPPYRLLSPHDATTIQPYRRRPWPDRPATARLRARETTVGRHRRRGGAQRAHLRGLPRAGGAQGPGARGEGSGGRRLHHGGAVARRPDVTLRLRRRPAAPDGDPGAAICRGTGSAGSRRSVDCSSRSRTAAASSSGTTTSAARPRSAASPRRTSPAGARCRQPNGGSGTLCGRMEPAICGSTRRPSVTRSSAGSVAMPKRARLLFEWSMVEMVERYLDDERMHLAYLGQGVIGTNASPHDPGTASVWFHHASGRMAGMPGTWGYVEGGMGMVSFLLCDIARELGAVVATGVPVARILPGEGVELASGERIGAPAGRLQRRSCASRSASWATRPNQPGRSRCARCPTEGITVKVNMTLSELPNFTARPGTPRATPHRADQHAAQQGGVARVPSPGERGRASAADLERALPADGVRPTAWSPTGCTR